MRLNLTKRQLRDGKRVIVAAPVFTSPALVEMIGAKGFDAVFIDCEHGSAGWEEVENMVRAAELVGATPIVRVQENSPSIITRTLDRGAGGIQVPHVNTRADAEAAVRHAKFAPLGVRGFSGGRSAYGEDMSLFSSRANDETMVIAMIEDVEAIRNLDEILTVEDIDVFFVAPGDLSQSMGYPGRPDHPEVQAIIDAALLRIKASGRCAGVLTKTDQMEHYLRLGVRYLYVSVSHLLDRGIQELLASFRAVDEVER